VQTPLPVDQRLEEIVSIVRRDRAAVIVAPPGAGKTTRIPPALLPLGRTILLQPRRVAARALARRIASEHGWTIGEEIGWQIRFERRFNDRTRLLVATEGILTARLQADPLLSDFGVVVLDEFHERSIHADLALALVKQAAESRHDLAVVVMSATMNAEAVAKFLGAQVIEIDAARFPVEIRYAPKLAPHEAIADVAKSARGHILCFLPGAREIERTRGALALPNIFPLHGSLDVDEQERALAPSRERKIILATNVAETSLTVDGVTDVVDAGLQKILRYDAETAIDHLHTEQISLDSADQRAGRAGRTAPGRATRLWDERQMLRPHREPEVRRVDLAAAALDIFAWGGDPMTFAWFERPPEHRLAAAVELLQKLGAIERAESVILSREDGEGSGAHGTMQAPRDPSPSSRLRMTRLGEAIRRLPLHPRLARVLLEARGAEAAVRVVALLSEDSRRAPRGGEAIATRCDALVLSESRHLDPIVRELSRLVPRGPAISEDDLLRAIYAGYPDRLAMRREPGSPRLLLASGTGAELARESGVREGEFLVALDVSGDLVRMASYVDREWIAPTHRETVHELVNGKVRATVRVWHGALLLREIAAKADPIEAEKLLAREAKLDPLLERRLAFAGIELDRETLFAHAVSGKTRVDEVDVELPFDVRRKLEQLAPAAVALPSGRSARLDYREDGSVVASVKLQELFGLAETPRIGPGKTPVTFALLSPNGRPVQVTQDLRSFWNGAYQEVRKELRGRYPKHPWPDDPWTAQATHRTKRR
jgi:ATP-dependent helicase HrpB